MIERDPEPARIVLRGSSMLRSFVVPALGVALVALVGCPGPSTSEPDPNACHDDVVAADFDRTTPTSFARDVMPIFRTSCAFSSCHGESSGAANGIVLAGSDAPAVRQALLATKATSLPTMPLVTPGDTAKSFLLRKIDGTQCALDAQCEGRSCGESMPQGEGLLPVATRDVIRRWILQGAPP